MLTEAQKALLRETVENFRVDCDSSFPEHSKTPATIADVAQLAIYVQGTMLELIEKL